MLPDRVRRRRFALAIESALLALTLQLERRALAIGLGDVASPCLKAVENVARRSEVQRQPVFVSLPENLAL